MNWMPEGREWGDRGLNRPLTLEDEAFRQQLKRELSSIQVPEALTASTLEALRREAGSTVPARPWWQLRNMQLTHLSAVAAGLLIVVFIGLTMTSRMDGVRSGTSADVTTVAMAQATVAAAETMENAAVEGAHAPSGDVSTDFDDSEAMMKSAPADEGAGTSGESELQITFAESVVAESASDPSSESGSVPGGNDGSTARNASGSNAADGASAEETTAGAAADEAPAFGEASAAAAASADDAEDADDTAGAAALTMAASSGMGGSGIFESAWTGDFIFDRNAFAFTLLNDVASGSIVDLEAADSREVMNGPDAAALLVLSDVIAQRWTDVHVRTDLILQVRALRSGALDGSVEIPYSTGVDLDSGIFEWLVPVEDAEGKTIGMAIVLNGADMPGDAASFFQDALNPNGEWVVVAVVDNTFPQVDTTWWTKAIGTDGMRSVAAAALNTVIPTYGGTKSVLASDISDLRLLDVGRGLEYALFFTHDNQSYVIPFLQNAGPLQNGNAYALNVFTDLMRTR